NSAYIQLDAIHLTRRALLVANRERLQVARHLGGGSELDGVLVTRAGRVGNNLAVGDGGVALVDNRGDVKGRLVVRLVEAREGNARVGGLHLRHFVFAALISAEVKAAQLVIEMSGVLD